MMLKKQTSPWARLKVLYVLPVAALVLFAASCNNPKDEADATDASALLKVDEKLDASANPLCIVDGKEVSTEEFKNLKSDEIDHIEVLKSEAATSQWGSKGANGVIVVTTKKSPYAKEKNVEEVIKMSRDSLVFNVVEKMPEFEGGAESMMKFLQQNIKYPEEAKKNGTQGRVMVQFVVKKDGSIDDAKVVKSVSPELDAEALRVVKAMPKWTPGEQRGEKVNVLFTLPVMFRMNAEK